MRIFGWSVAGLLVLALLLSLAFGLDWLGIEWYGFLGPKREAKRRKVFRETRSYNEAKEQQLIKYRYEWMRAETAEAKAAILATVRIAFADYDEDRLQSAELRSFLRQAKYGN